MDGAVDRIAVEALTARIRRWAPVIVSAIPSDAAAALAALALADPVHGPDVALPPSAALFAEVVPGEAGDAAVLAAVQVVGQPLLERLVDELTPMAVELGETPVSSVQSLLPAARQMFAVITSDQEGAAVTAVRFLAAMRPGTLGVLRDLNEAVLTQLDAAFTTAPTTGDETSILAAHGVTYLGPSVATALAVLAGTVPQTGDGTWATTAIGAGVGLAWLALTAAPEPTGYRAAVLARERAEYVRAARAVHGTVQVSGHLFALTEDAFPPQDVDVSGTGLAAAVPGGVVVRTGTADGWVYVTVDVAEQEPPAGVDEELEEEVTDLSYHAERGFASVLGAGGVPADGLRHVTPPLSGDYRVRVRASGRDPESGWGQESYRLTVWPAPAAPAEVRQRSDRLGFRLRGEPEPPPDPAELAGLEKVFVSYHQLVVSAGGDGDGLGVYTVGGPLLHIGGPGEVTVITGPHTGMVRVRAVGLPTAPVSPGIDRTGWEAVEQATVWAPDGRIGVHGLMGSPPASDPNLAAAGPGLYRLEVRARHRRPEHVETIEGNPPEAYELLAWPVSEDVGHLTIRTDDLAEPAWEPRPERAAQLAMLAILTGRCADPLDPNAPARTLTTPAVTEQLPRARVVRSARVPATPGEALTAVRATLDPDHDGGHVLPVGPLQVALTRQASSAPDPASLTLTWSWAWSAGAPPDPDDDDQAWAARLAVPDPRPTTVNIRATPTGSGDTDLAVTHDDVLASHAIPLGLVWEYLLAQAAASLRDPAPGPAAHPWQDLLDRLAEQARGQRAQQRRQHRLREAAAFGGRPLTPRLRNVQAATRPIAGLDRDLLDALAEASPQRQREIAVWTARRACTVARLTEVAWIAEALRTVERGEPLPAAFDDHRRVWDQLLTDPDVPRTLVTSPTGAPNALQQAMAFPALLSLAKTDPLAAAIDALHAATIAYGPDCPLLLHQARRAFPELARP